MTGDDELKQKIRKSDMSEEAITDAINEYTNEKLNNSQKTDGEKKIRYLEKRIFKLIKDQVDKNNAIEKNGL